MARGTQLATLLEMLRAECGMSTNVNVGLNSINTHKLRLRREQERLYHDYDWPFLYGSYDVEMEAGERYYDMPIDPETVQKVERKWGGSWVEICHGIGADEYNSHDSDEDLRSDPVEKWQMRVNKTDDSLIDNDQFEAWPIPASDDVTILRFWGKRRLPPLTSNDHKAILDDQLIVLYSAATLIKDAEEARKKLAEANSYYNTLKKRQRKNRKWVLGGKGGISLPYRPGPVRVAQVIESP